MFRVKWLQSALNDLAAAWVQTDSTERAAITAASNQIDKRLSGDPEEEGESRPKGRRITFVPPLAVTFRVEPDGRTVSVVKVRLFRQGRP
jgi:hypothetical protein